jgi:hypothetical protein
MDGAMTIGSEAAAHIIWRTPQEVFEARLNIYIRDFFRRMRESDYDIWFWTDYAEYLTTGKNKFRK